MMQTEGTVPDGQTAAVFLTDLRGGFDESGMVGPELQIKTLLFCNLFFFFGKIQYRCYCRRSWPGV